MHVGLRVRGQIIVENVRDVVDVQAACRHIGGHQDGVLAAAETLQRLLAALLAQVATQRLGWETAQGQFAGQFARAGTCAHEDQRAGDLLDLEETRQAASLSPWWTT